MQNWIITAMVNHDEGHTVTLIKQIVQYQRFKFHDWED